MAVCILFWIGLGWWAIATLVQWASAALARRRRPAAPVRHKTADFSIVAPLAGAHDASEAYVGRLAELARAGAEILICVASERDEAVERVRAQWPGAPILIGSDGTFNPKLNNVRKGLEAASRPVVALCDAGIALTAHDLVTAAAQLSDDVGLVLALKAGERPENFAAEMECAYINGHQARFLLAADRLGMPVASGGVTILTRDVLERIGGHQGFLNYIADDYSVVRTVRDRVGQTTWLANVMPRLPLGRRRWSDVWRRQVRWGSTRLNLTTEVKALVLFEPAIGWLVSGLAGGVALVACGVGMGYLALAIALHTLAWFAAEAWFASGYRLPFGPRAWAAALAREALVPVLAAQAWRGRHRIDWRGTNLAAGWRPGDGAAGKSV
ncbi:MAG: ceramide glucosyltransferase [Rhodospirillaceae bacterium]|jgi:ceramide glucosyltransferase|nr:ceramide glucosyltransferase [Rhodospirillaceae bacterium]MEA2812169.1 ceramide glucosyltransferase [Rhodospirillaceae bacterium]